MKLREARTAYAERAWRRAHDPFAVAESEAPLDAEDYNRFAVTAHLLARLPEYFEIRGRAYKSLLERGDRLGAAEAALWLGTQKIIQGEAAEGGGWIARAARIVGEDGTDSRAAAFLNVAGAFEAAGRGDLEGAARIAEECVRAARRLGSRSSSTSIHQQGLFLLAAGHTAEGLACLDEAMLGVASGECSALVEGIVYCGVIQGCWTSTSCPGAGVDLGDDAVGARSRSWQLHRRVQGPPGRAQAAPRRWSEALDELAAVSLRTRTSGVRPGCRVRGNLDRLPGRFDEAEEAFALQRDSASIRSPGSRCSGWRAAACRQRRQWPGGRSPRRAGGRRSRFSRPRRRSSSLSVRPMPPRSPLANCGTSLL